MGEWNTPSTLVLYCQSGVVQLARYSQDLHVEPRCKDGTFERVNATWPQYLWHEAICLCIRWGSEGLIILLVPRKSIMKVAQNDASVGT